MGTELPQNINFPEPRDQHEADLYQTLQDILYLLIDAIEKLREDLP